MKQAFILPIPKSDYRLEAEENCLDVVAETKFWQRIYDQLLEGRGDWDEVMEKISQSSQLISRLTTSVDGHTLLHLAVLWNKKELVESLLGLCPHLKYKQNDFGWTPYEFSLFLPRKEISERLLPPRISDANCSPNLPFPPSESIEFLPQPLFENKQVLEEILVQSKKAKMADAIPAEKIWMGIYFDEEIQKGSHPKISIQYINDQVKFGIFADTRIPSCAFVGEYTGIVKERKKKELAGKIYSMRYTVWGMGRRQFIIDAEKSGNFTRFINHSPNPNLALQSVYWRGLPRMIFVAIKEIPKDAQLTFDYGSLFWKEQKEIPLIF